ncbi:ABC transporter ATP-binding protein, partial [Thioclava sp. BHET1]
MSAPLLDIAGLNVTFRNDEGAEAEALRGVDLRLEPGKVLGLVGESGSGKSVMIMACLQLLPGSARISGSAKFKGQQLVGMSPRRINAIRGKSIGCIFQDPLSAFNPVQTLGQQVVEAIRLHDRSVSRRAAMKEAERLFEMVAIPHAARRVHQYPHEFSGGMRQRAMIAMALANRPELLIADEPTTALDVTIQAQILDLMRRLQKEIGMSILFITHDMGVVAEMADDVAVMYAGAIVEQATVGTLFAHPSHPYT